MLKNCAVYNCIMLLYVEAQYEVQAVIYVFHIVLCSNFIQV